MTLCSWPSTFSARNLERVGDHVRNIAESVYYFYTGEHYEK